MSLVVNGRMFVIDGGHLSMAMIVVGAGVGWIVFGGSRSSMAFVVGSG